MTCVMDASAAVAIVLNRPEAEPFVEMLSTADLVISPDLYISEVTNAFWKYLKFKQLSKTICEQRLNTAIQLVDDFIKSSELYEEAFSLAYNTNHPVYDAFYLVLARRRDGILLTLDNKIKSLALKHSIRTA